ncbi:MAG: ATP-binding protein [Flammeovirgaceae bacterium]|nr:ATP-binding protein [Flammeovirgaceae bacterium]
MGITLRKELPLSELVLKAADIELLEQVIINLVLNSRDALKDREGNLEIVISAEGFGQKIIIMVTDSGIGILPENLENIFTPFFSTKKNGSGIGLSLSRQIILLHKGTISVSSEKGKYTCFRLEIWYLQCYTFFFLVILTVVKVFCVF